MAISFVDSASGTTSVTVPAHISGDVLVVFAYRSSSSYATIPGDFTEVAAVTRADGSAKCAVKVATSASETCTGFTNATRIGLAVYRGVDPSTPTGATGTGSGLGTTLTYPALDTNVDDGTSMALAFGAANDNGVTLDARTSFTSRLVSSATGFEIHISDALSSGEGTDGEALGLSVPWVAMMVELIEDKTTPGTLFWSFP